MCVSCRNGVCCFRRCNCWQGSLDCAPPCSQTPLALQAVSVALQVLQLCTQAAKYIEGRQLYKAFKTLEAVQLDHGAVLCGSQGGYLPLLPSAGAYASSRDGTPLKDAAGGGGGGTAASDGGGGGDAELAEQLGPLAGFLRERVAELVALLEQRALSDFNNSWLANVRAQARTIGMRAIRWAAAERQQEEVLTRQRKQLLQRLDDFQDVRQAGALVAQALHESEASQPPPATPLPLPTAADSAAAGTPGSPGAAAASGSPSHSPVPDSSSSKVSSGSTSATAARLATFRAARQAASTSPTRSPHSTPASAAAAEVAVPATNPSPPGTAASATAASACGHAPTPAAASAAAAQTPPPQQRAGVQRPEAAAAATGGWPGAACLAIMLDSWLAPSGFQPGCLLVHTLASDSETTARTPPHSLPPVISLLFLAAISSHATNMMSCRRLLVRCPPLSHLFCAQATFLRAWT